MSITNDKKQAEEDLDQYGVWVKAGPETVDDDTSDLEGFELSDLTDMNIELTSEEEDLLGSLEDDSSSEISEMSLDDIEDFSIPDEETENEPLNLEFDDLEAVERELSEPEPSPSRPFSSGSDTGDILSKIEAELAGIKSELAELKRELSILRPVSAAPKVEKAGTPAEEHPEEEIGFFAEDEDDDETIALTGDELDNILNTADITEEKGESDILPEDLEIDMKSEDEDIISLEEPPAAEESIPVTTPEELAIIDEYNRELDNFGTEDFQISEEDSLDEADVISLPDEAEPSEELNIEDFPAEEAENPLENVEFDLESLQELELEEPAEFEEELEEMEIVPADEDLPDLEMEIPEERLAISPLPPDMDIDSGITELGELEADDLEAEELAVEEFETESLTPERGKESSAIPENLRDEIKSVLQYMDQLLESLPEDKIQEFANSEHFEVYRKLFEELGLE